MARKAPSGGKKGKNKPKRRLSHNQSKMNTTADKYRDSLGWSQDVGRTLADAPAPKGPETLKVQCDMCGSMLKIPKPKRSKYTVTCTYPECGHEMKFD
jgi:rRNA maturation protein Nop10